MPRKKPPSHGRKDPLLFLESPVKGRECLTVPPLPCAVNPQQVPSVPIKQSSSFLTWVTPQFEVGHAPNGGAMGRHQKRTDKALLKHRKCERKLSSASKLKKLKKPHLAFVPLTFNSWVSKSHLQKQAQTPSSTRPELKRSFLEGNLQGCGVESSCERVQRSEMLCQKFKGIPVGEGNVIKTVEHNPFHTVGNNSNVSPLCHPRCQNGSTGNKAPLVDHLICSSEDSFTLPHVNTPVIASLLSPGNQRVNLDGGTREGLDGPDGQPGAWDHWNRKFDLRGGFAGCTDPQSVQVLVPDTPEKQYGLKVTWRQRPHIMQFLQEQGKLSEEDVLISVRMGPLART
ncbi:RAD9, HUS1, RAD1-interacting nuclear orphan protein 1 [Callorhinchus milii]|uniref:RAD9, HUS1, RAD1-interacting nuclear orphan protein 1 n=1 Tax=Callorhinchus milii TaxID=7868 RepID=UPI0004572197|nr:RAD9, HUS1, RAD1-interacting nuclear orphan protein 1 [Callorhinchus milii]XP_007903305.1 RAD9, HUS1, RAD1-interacting nuclear orphan protein 1 [Callorhinchus milii]|eukprot:gi/632973748/ref/XP_007903304.1/ PREDICTED: RAD9, HUS1, RAD1-interacting nuclear orphan protein 1 [Callorhinchus milii]